ncbi:hypothetical protein CC2G_013553 [Coprinopsis cinerea AmutBmut pab1-1]|nr:hypothetical protein CC2G_013553 [Coprinopsis cinerea AmutBmut pab1-1]
MSSLIQPGGGWIFAQTALMALRFLPANHRRLLNLTKRTPLQNARHISRASRAHDLAFQITIHSPLPRRSKTDKLLLKLRWSNYGSNTSSSQLCDA